MHLKSPFLRNFLWWGAIALAIAIFCSVFINLLGPKSPLSIFFIPFFFIVYQPIYMILGIAIGSTDLGRVIFYGSPWIAIPFWTVAVFMWNGLVGGTLSLIIRFILRSYKAEQGAAANP